MTQARTDRANYLFKVSEGPDGKPWVSTEPRYADVPILRHALLGFDLPKGTTIQKAEQIARYLNANLDDVNVTIFDNHPMFNHR